RGAISTPFRAERPVSATLRSERSISGAFWSEWTITLRLEGTVSTLVPTLLRRARRTGRPVPPGLRWSVLARLEGPVTRRTRRTIGVRPVSRPISVRSVGRFVAWSEWTVPARLEVSISVATERTCAWRTGLTPLALAMRGTLITPHAL